jgi:uncharacterized iron-regulated protein
MIKHSVSVGLRVCGLVAILLATGCSSTRSARRPDAAPPRASMWVNTLRSEPIAFDELLDDLQEARVIFLGEYHSLSRHHALQIQVLEGLAQRGVPLVLAMEQFEYFTQPALDEFNRGAIDLPGLIAASDWAARWRGHTNYHALLMAAQEHQIPVLALNARAETIRAIGRRGLEGIDAEQRSELPAEVDTDDPVYERLLDRVLGVHMAFDPKKLRPVFEAQVARDEMMAHRLSSFLASAAGADRTAVVICGRGHCEYGLGMPDRVARRMPGLAQRIVLFSQSGDLHLTEEEQSQAREIEIPHQFLRELGRAPSDFMHLVEPRVRER